MATLPGKQRQRTAAKRPCGFWAALSNPRDLNLSGPSLFVFLLMKSLSGLSAENIYLGIGCCSLWLGEVVWDDAPQAVEAGRELCKHLASQVRTRRWVNESAVQLKLACVHESGPQTEIIELQDMKPASRASQQNRTRSKDHEKKIKEGHKKQWKGQCFCNSTKTCILPHQHDVQHEHGDFRIPGLLTTGQVSWDQGSLCGC